MLPLIGTLMLTCASGMSTSTRPLGCSVNANVPPMVRMPAALMLTLPVTVSVYAPVVNGIVTEAGVAPDGIVITSVTAWPVSLILTVTTPLIVSPSRPTSCA